MKWLVLLALVGCHEHTIVHKDDRALIERVEADYPVLKCTNSFTGAVMCVDLERNPFICFSSDKLYYPFKSVCLWGVQPTIPYKYLPSPYRDFTISDGKPLTLVDK